MQELVKGHIERSIDAKQKLIQTGIDNIVLAGEMTAACFQAGGKVLLCGNGGSAGDAQHIATEFSIRYRAKPERPSLPAISLATDSSAITACGNDFGFDKVFSRQVEGLGREGDVLIGITTSGNSPNVIEALRAARARKMHTIILTGGTGGKIFSEHRDMVDVAVRVPSDETARIQECHIMVGQIICAIVEKILYGFN
ncbi:MAG: D-sedoheptulose 7-phosphate isomerase [Spirochaetia bacterium]|nr:D-sedoheptulose 7-phosphate isomerase [Spirochaetia bacterium]